MAPCSAGRPKGYEPDISEAPTGSVPPSPPFAFGSQHSRSARPVTRVQKVETRGKDYTEASLFRLVHRDVEEATMKTGPGVEECCINAGDVIPQNAPRKRLEAVIG